MAVERKFIAEGARRARVEKHLVKELKRAGYGGMDLPRGVLCRSRSTPRNPVS